MEPGDDVFVEGDIAEEVARNWDLPQGSAMVGGEDEEEGVDPLADADAGSIDAGRPLEAGSNAIPAPLEAGPNPAVPRSNNAGLPLDSKSNDAGKRTQKRKKNKNKKSGEETDSASEDEDVTDVVRRINGAEVSREH